MPLDQIDVDELDKGEEKEMSFFEHLEELRWHIIRALSAIIVIAIVIFALGDKVFDYVLEGPLHDWFPTYRFICYLSETVGLGDSACFGPPQMELIATDIGEQFITHIKVAFMLGLVIAFPYVFWEIWRFVKPALHINERQHTRGTVLVCSTLFSVGVLFGYFVIAPFALSFLVGYDIGSVVPKPRLASYMSYLVMFTLPIGIVFELPVVIYFLAKLGIVTSKMLKEYRRHAFVGLLILAAMITPPDVFTQLVITGPLYMLYEISIIVAARVQKSVETLPEVAS